MGGKNSEIFDYTPSIDPPPFELPNQRREVMVKVKKVIDSVPQALQDNLLGHNMDKVTLHPRRKNVIVVSGIPPVNGFDQHTVLVIVQRYFPGATLA